MAALMFVVLVSYLYVISGEESSYQMRGSRDLPSTDAVVKKVVKASTAAFGTLIADNTYSRVEGEFTIFTHLTFARGFEGEAHDEDGEHHEKDEDHHGRNLAHTWTNYKWQNPNCDLVISVGDCHSSNGGQDFSALLTDVVNRWNHVPQNQELTGTTFIPNGITFQKATCGNDYRVTCDNSAVLNRISSCNGDYGATGWAGLASIWTYTGTKFLAKGLSKINEHYLMDEAQSQHVLCQEIGHTMPMGHQDESGADLNTCMDYSVWTSANRYPNQHDVEILDTLYDVCGPTNAPTFAPTRIKGGLGGKGAPKL